jgi:hypothetical protein
MIADTMIPEAFEVAHDYAGLITVAGFLEPSSSPSWVADTAMARQCKSGRGKRVVFDGSEGFRCSGSVARE